MNIYNLILNLDQQQQLINIYERNVKSNFRLLEECIKQFGTFSNDLIKYEYYAKDIPDERCTIIILAMLAHDLIILNNNNNDIDFRHQLIFEELKEKYSNKEEIEIFDISVLWIPIEEINIQFLLQQLFILSKIHILFNLVSQSVLDTMNYDILDRLEPLSELNDDDDERFI